MKRVVIWGTGTTYANYKFILKDDLEIVAFVETEPKETFFEGKPVLSPDELSTVEYDDIIVFSIYHDAIFDKVREYRIKGEVILSDQYDQYEEYVRLSGENPFHKKLNKLDGVKNAEVLITGLSYHDEGISVDQFARPVINMAMGSQDLFYDYEMAKYVIEEKKIGGGGKILHCWNGLFQYGIRLLQILWSGRNHPLLSGNSRLA